MKKPIVITGGCGLVGSRVAKALAEEGFPVVVLDKTSPKERGIVFPETVVYRQVDLRDREKTREAIRGGGVVLHLAANIGALSYMHDHQAEIIADHSATDAALYPALVAEGVSSVIYSSSSMVYERATRYPYTEEDLPGIPPPKNVYGFSKLAGEYFCKSFSVQHGLPHTILRYHNIYGPGEYPKGVSPGDIHVIPAIIEKVLSGQYPLRLLGGVDATRPFTYIDDAVEATVMVVKEVLLKNQKVMNTDFNIGPAKAIKILDMAEKIWELLGDGRPFKYEVDDTKAASAIRREMDPSKIKSILGWETKVSLDEGIKKTAEWIKSRRG